MEEKQEVNIEHTAQKQKQKQNQEQEQLSPDFSVPHNASDSSDSMNASDSINPQNPSNSSDPASRYNPQNPTNPSTPSNRPKSWFNQTDRRKMVSRSLLIMLLDILLIFGSYAIALLLRFDFEYSAIPDQYIRGFGQLIIPYILITVVTYWIMRLYHSIWRFASINELQRLAIAWLIDEAIIAIIYLITRIRMPIIFWVGGGIGVLISTGGLRFLYRFLRSFSRIIYQKNPKKQMTNVMVIGAGSAGRDIIHEMVINQRLNMRVNCIIDDNSGVWGRMLEGVPVIGGRSQIMNAAVEYKIDLIIFAIPSIRGQQRKDILEICQHTGCNVRIVPSLGSIASGRISVNTLCEVEIKDLLGRDPIVINNEEIHRQIAGKVILVTGGGGSIGSELCRQIAADNPKTLIIFDIYENNAYAIQQELLRKYGDTLHLVTLIGSVRNTNRINDVIATYHPDVIFHAAAHKHVPLMEDSPNEAIKNNVLGTYKVAKAAIANQVKRFVLISTDKAVNPTNLMGASKRLCEMIIQMMNQESLNRYRQGHSDTHTEFVAVRFGNVLGSNGSVIPLFKEQIAAGGPVTVTDKRMIRYFMTIQEAVSLVLQASYYAQGGEIFVLDMGEPVKIDDMARQLIRLSGYEPDVDIKITYTGLRPGEKLYEELLMDEEGLTETPNKLIHVGKPIEMDYTKFRNDLRRLDELSYGESREIKQLVAEIVPTYRPEVLMRKRIYSSDKKTVRVST